MKFDLPKLDDLKNESDVEQKLVYPLLTTEEPFGFGIGSNEILTKQNIRRLPIGKGKDRKSYFPDYLILIGGIPLVVIEAKEPGEDLDEAFREARLYASEINAIFHPGINPLVKVVATNGARLLAGSWDSATPQIDMAYSDLSVSSERMAELHGLIGRSALAHDFTRFAAAIRPTRLWKPRRMIGGISIQQEEVGHNTFGATISAEFAHIFNPHSREDRVRIARDGYIPSKRRQRYVDPIDRVIRGSRPPSETESKPIEDTSKPEEIFKALKTPKSLEHQVLLIVGGVGVGKSTFIDHLQYAALPKDLIDTTVWLRVNMNNAPASANEIYNWLRLEIIHGCRAAYPELDFDTLEAIKAVFSVEVRRFEKGIGKLYQGNQQLHDEKLADYLQELTKDVHQQAIAYTRYCSTERGKLLVIVVDNCDKRTLDLQLLMFEAAQWIQKEFRALVILPLREETYDNHRDKPPLDTALKDLVFRIEPPLFQQVLVSRVQLALNEITQSGSKTFRYDLPNGFHVEYPQTDKAYYLTSIVHAIFEHDRQIRRLILGLSGRNIRRALEIFLEFCTSGHITEDFIFKIRRAEGRFLLPLHLVVRVLLLMNRRFYDSDRSYMKNVLATDPKDAQPNHFSRLMILRWLLKKFSQKGRANLKGYFAIRDVINDLSIYGVDPAIIRREVEYLAKAHCIVTEDFRIEGMSDEDLLCLAPAGFVHLEILSNVNYLAAVAEDTWFYTEEEAKRVAERIKSLEQQYALDVVIANARDVLKFLSDERLSRISSTSVIVEHALFEELTSLADVTESIDAFERSLTSPPWASIRVRFPQNTKVTGTVVNSKDFGVFVELEPGITGLVHSSRLPNGFRNMDQFLPGERVVVEILSINGITRRIGMAYVGAAVNEKLTDAQQLSLEILPTMESEDLV